MLSSRIRAALVATALGLIAFPGFASEPPSLAELSAVAQFQSISPFQSISQQQLEASRSQLAQAAVALETALVPGSEQGEAWKAYLDWPGIQKQLTPGAKVDLLALRSTYDKLTSGANGLERPEFRRAANAVGKLFDLARVRRAKDQPAYLQRQAAALTKYLQRDSAATDPRASWQIEQRLALFDGIDQAPQATAKLRRELAKPNLYGSASERVLALLARRPVSEVRPIADSILGTRVVGSGDTRGSIHLRLAPSTSAARLEFLLTGNIASDTRGYNGPVVICTSGATQFHGSKVVELTDDCFTVLGADMDASTTSRTRGITKVGGKFGKRLVEAIAQKKVNEARSEANLIASKKAEEQIAAEFDEQVTAEVRLARSRYDDMLRKPLRRRGASPQQTLISTTNDRLSLSALQASPRQLGASSDPPPELSGDFSLRLHQSALNNLADAFVGGATIQQRTSSSPIEIDAVLPERLRAALANRPREKEAGDKPFQPWAIELRRERPVSFSFSEQTITALIHTTRIEAGDEAFRGWDIEIGYRVSQQGGRWVAELAGEVDVLPTKFDPNEPGARIGSRDRAVRRNLAKQLTARAEQGQGFPRRIELQPMSLAKLGKAGLNELVLRQLVADDGWLSLSMDAR